MGTSRDCMCSINIPIKPIETSRSVSAVKEVNVGSRLLYIKSSPHPTTPQSTPTPPYNINARDSGRKRMKSSNHIPIKIMSSIPNESLYNVATDEKSPVKRRNPLMHNKKPRKQINVRTSVR